MNISFLIILGLVAISSARPPNKHLRVLQKRAPLTKTEIQSIIGANGQIYDTESDSLPKLLSEEQIASSKGEGSPYNIIEIDASEVNKKFGIASDEAQNDEALTDNVTENHGIDKVQLEVRDGNASHISKSSEVVEPAVTHQEYSASQENTKNESEQSEHSDQSVQSKPLELQQSAEAEHVDNNNRSEKSLKSPTRYNINNHDDSATFYNDDSTENQHESTDVVKNFYFFANADDDDDEEVNSELRLGGVTKKKVNVLFVKAPTYGHTYSGVYPIEEEKTVVYVLVKKPDELHYRLPQDAKLVKPSKPEVFYIKYKTQLEAEEAIRRIQSGSAAKDVSINARILGTNEEFVRTINHGSLHQTASNVKSVRNNE